MNTRSPRSTGRLKRLALVAGVLLATSAAGAAHANPLVQGSSDDRARPVPAVPGGTGVWLVRLQEPALVATLRSTLPADGALARDQLHSEQARSHLDRLAIAQEHFLAEASSALGRPLAPISEKYRFRHAMNGMAVRLTPAEAIELAKHPEVAAMTPLRTVPVSTDHGPRLIGANRYWEGQLESGWDGLFGSGFEAPAEGNRGEGMVVGVIDTGLNFGHPSFAAQAQDGYQHVNPLGSGQYLGLCGPGPSPDWTPACNDKVIGAYDFISELMPEVWQWDPDASNGPGPQDENGHGTHVAGTAVGNPVLATPVGAPAAAISGVAPRANLVVFDTCYTTGDGGGSCLNVSLVAALDRAVSDGVVDVINYSIAGGSSPWQQHESLGFLDAVDSGIFVAAAAGNSGPSAGWIDHVEPWVMTVAASTHQRGAFANTFDITGPAPVPAELTGLALTIPGSSTPLTASIAGDFVYDAEDPLQCEPAAAGSYAGKIVLIRRGTCTFVLKVQNAQAGGAAAVILANDSEGALNPALDGTSIPVATVPLSLGNAFSSFIEGASGAAQARLNFPATALPQTADVIASFSSRGPASYSLLKPDVAAPGDNILAALHGAEDAYGLLSGTSMASPHMAGAAALLRKARPDWTVAEVKSAFMLTARNTGIGDAGPAGGEASVFAMGAGRAQAAAAYHSGLVMNETAYRFLLADPDRDGEPMNLNVPSLASTSCVGTCSFVRRFRNPTGETRTWSFHLDGVEGQVTPSTLSLAPGASGSVEFAIDVGAAEQGSYLAGEVRLVPDGGDLQPLHMPVAVRAEPYALVLEQTELSAQVPAGGTTQIQFSITNGGNAGLTWELPSGMRTVPVVNQPPNTSNGLTSSLYNDTGTGAFVADDIVLDQTTEFRTLSVPGFLFASYGDTADMYADSFTWTIYADAGGKPAGHPGDGSTPVWSLTLPPDAPGVTPGSNTLEVDLAAAGASLVLPPGRYWLSATVDLPSLSIGPVPMVAWYRHILSTQQHGIAQQFNNHPEFGGSPDAVWLDLDEAWGGHFGAAMLAEADRQCTPDWLTPSSTSGAPGAGTTDVVELLIDTSGLAPGEHVGQLCLASNDAAQPLTVVPVRLQVTTP